MQSQKPVFKSGEKLEYRIRYGFITAGNVSFLTEKKIYLVPAYFTLR